MFRHFLALALVALTLSGMGPSARAQGLITQPTPFSTWLDFRKQSASFSSRGLPIWIESVQRVSLVAGRTTFRIRFRHLGELDNQLQVRVFFKDLPDALPSATGWTETGSQPFVAGQLGEGLGVDTSESMIVPAGALDYLDIEVAGDGGNVRGAFLSSLRTHQGWHALDFATPAPLTDPFGVPARMTPQEDDRFLYGRVRATLDAAPLKLSSKSALGVYQFSLDTPPLIAALTFEILDANPGAPMNVFVNGQSLGVAAISFPDLADPAYRGASHPLEKGLRFRYEGWLRARIMVPGHLLLGGANELTLQLPEESSPVVIRSVEIELKYPSTVFDYELHP